MLEYFTYKKVKKHKAEKKAEESASKRPVSPIDTNADEDAPVPPPTQTSAAELDWQSSDTEAATTRLKKTKTTTEDAAAGSSTAIAPASHKQPGRLALLFTRHRKTESGLQPRQGVVSPDEGERETKDISSLLDRLNLSARNNKVVTTDSSTLLQSFTQVFKDLVNGVPTAVDDLQKLVEDRDGTISRGFDKLPSSLKKLVVQLPDKITNSLGPEILAAAAASQGIKTDSGGGIKGVAKKILVPHNLAELVTKPGAIVGMLRAIVEVLKTRWPAFIGMNVIWSVALTLLLFVLWYCHKRGREERLERERTAQAIDGADRIEELSDDPALPAPEYEARDGLSVSSSSVPLRKPVPAENRDA
ncbi:RING-like domain-containing protein [Ophiocordyceps camponoti-floridani]|uniref:RING-like domain-containing protein n=1 Tax=Ophiocordyceps camponoti-floridani TaxID=2030778 RepID=A0A8H4VD45_9HYPO|nr:RING-like domain-containing protein [Ophiocordyceps camponoti-floridani]